MNDEENTPHLPYEIHDINVVKTEDGDFKIILGTKGDIEGLYKGFAEAEIGRDILEKFVKKASELLQGE